MNRTIKDATVKRFYYEAHDELRVHLADFVTAYNFAKRLKTLKGLTPYEYICKVWTKEPERFSLNPLQQMPGLNIWCITRCACRCRLIEEHDDRALRRCVRSGRLIARLPSIEAVCAGTEMRNLQEAAGDHDVLQKVDHLILVGKVVMEEDGRRQSEPGQADCHRPHTKTKKHAHATANLEDDGDGPTEGSQR
jgi:hypothetical protein